MEGKTADPSKKRMLYSDEMTIVRVTVITSMDAAWKVDIVKKKDHLNTPIFSEMRPKNVKNRFNSPVLEVENCFSLSISCDRRVLI